MTRAPGNAGRAGALSPHSHDVSFEPDLVTVFSSAVIGNLSPFLSCVGGFGAVTSRHLKYSS